MPSPHLPTPKELALPIRDLIRGVRRAASGSLSLIEPAGAVLPKPVRDLMYRIARSVDEAGEARIGIKLPPAEAIRRAAGDLAEGRDAAIDASGFAAVAAYGLSVALARSGDDKLLISETVAAMVFSEAASHRAPDCRASDQAASLIRKLVQHHVAGIAPGTGVALSEEQYSRIYLAVFALMLWLLAERPSQGENEDQILTLSVALAAAIGPEILEARNDDGQISELLRANARMI